MTLDFPPNPKSNTKHGNCHKLGEVGNLGMKTKTAIALIQLGRLGEV
jgi:hypothetical protein